MTLEILPQAFTLAKITPETPLPAGDFVFFARTDREHSLVCPTSDVPPSVLSREDGWRGLRVVGTLDFSLVGILARISGVLADAGIGIFAVSTFDTDYILLKEENLARACAALRAAGMGVNNEDSFLSLALS